MSKKTKIITFSLVIVAIVIGICSFSLFSDGKKTEENNNQNTITKTDEDKKTDNTDKKNIDTKKEDEKKDKKTEPKEEVKKEPSKPKKEEIKSGFTKDKAISLVEKKYGKDDDTIYSSSDNIQNLNGKEGYIVQVKSKSLMKQGGTGVVFTVLVTPSGELIEM
ncbi:MAG: hypothetical protein ACRC1T_18145 [Clostridium chrysemydis]|uniref:hypothetical protein n=1 Tax=Clostridium TaxID=1485 RepID=UPI003F36785B